MTRRQELTKLNNADLVKIAQGLKPPIRVKTKWKKADLVQAILKHESQALSRPGPGAPQGKGPATRFDPKIGRVYTEAQKEAPQQQPANADFEAAVGKDELPKDGRGGVRPGSGRPPGMTAAKAAVKGLPQYPSNPIKMGISALFDLWASAAKLESLALEDEEAHLLALPLTQLQEFYFPGIIPEIAGTWIMLIFAVTRVIKPRLTLLAALREAKAKGVDTNQWVNRKTKEHNEQAGQYSDNRQNGQRKDGPSPKPDSGPA